MAVDKVLSICNRWLLCLDLNQGRLDLLMAQRQATQRLHGNAANFMRTAPEDVWRNIQDGVVRLHIGVAGIPLENGCSGRQAVGGLQQ
ncbi:hypothetical protein FB480_101730 [Agrobacterium vitis]|nr:hypothetical protein FB480_101730 [Agrobacterium vitis]